MVERPIKKSERQATIEANGVAEKNLESEPRHREDQEQALKTETPSEGKRSPSRQDRNKNSRKDKGGQQREHEPSRVNPALLRGPKPTKPKPPVIQVESTMDAEAPVDQEQDTSTES